MASYSYTRPLWRIRMGRWLRSVGALLLLLAMAWAVWGSEGTLFGAGPQTLSADGRAVRAIDGDSIALGSGQSAEEIRLNGIDAPEYRQTCKTAANIDWPCGKEARTALGRLVEGSGDLSCAVAARDKYGRTIATCRTAATPDIGAALVRAGWATSYAGHSEDGGYHDEESTARTARIGIWQGDFAAPADWRAQHVLSTDVQRLRD